MSKAIALALAITETAQESFESTSSHALSLDVWNRVLESSRFQELVFRNIKPEKNWLGIPMPDSLPNMNDFRDLKIEFSRRLDFFSSWGSVKSMFLMLEAEKLMASKVPEGFFSEMLYDFILEDCEQYLAGDVG